MSAARNLLDELGVIGATVRASGERRILRAGQAAIPAALVRRVRESKSDLLAILATAHDNLDPSPAEEQGRVAVAATEISGDRSLEAGVIEWLNQHPCPSPAGRCAWCGALETAGAVVVPFGTAPGTHTWLHAECWPAWHQARRAQAVGFRKASQASSATVEE